MAAQEAPAPASQFTYWLPTPNNTAVQEEEGGFSVEGTQPTVVKVSLFGWWVLLGTGGSYASRRYATLCMLWHTSPSLAVPPCRFHASPLSSLPISMSATCRRRQRVWSGGSTALRCPCCQHLRTCLDPTTRGEGQQGRCGGCAWMDRTAALGCKARGALAAASTRPPPAPPQSQLAKVNFQR